MVMVIEGEEEKKDEVDKNILQCISWYIIDLLKLILINFLQQFFIITVVVY